MTEPKHIEAQYSDDEGYGTAAETPTHNEHHEQFQDSREYFQDSKEHLEDQEADIPEDSTAHEVLETSKEHTRDKEEQGR